MATVVLQFQVNAGAVSTGVATVAAEDEVDLRLASYSGLQSIRYEIQAFPAGFAQPTGWSTDVSSGAYYFNASPIVGLTPPTITMPTTAEIAAGQWGKWIFRAIGTTSTGTITSDPRCAVKIVSPALGLNGIAFSEEDEFDATRAYPGELQEDLVEIDAAAIVSGGFVSSAAATRPIKVSGSTGAVTWSWEPNANVGMLGYGFTACSGVTNAGGAVAITAGGGAASLAGSTTATVSANGGALLLEGATTATLNATTGALSCTGGTTAVLTASAGACTITASTEVNVSPLLNVRRDDASTNTILDVATLRRTTAGTAANGIGGRLAFELEDSAGNADVAGTMAVDYLDATSASEDARILFRAQVAGTLTDSLSLRGTTIRAHGLAGSGSGFVAVDNNGDFSWNAGAGASATEKYLVNDTTTALANGVPIQALAAGLPFFCATAQPMTLTRRDASTNTVLPVFSLTRTTAGGVGAAGIGTALGLYAMDDDGQEVEVGRLDSSMSSAATTAHAATLGFWAATAGGIVQIGTWTGAGAFASTGTVAAGTGGFLGTAWDTATATSATVGVANMTALTVTPATTFSSTVTELRPNITTTVTPGIIASNATAAASPSPLVQYGPAFISSGGAWETGGGGSPKTTRGGFYSRGISSGTAGAEVVFIYDTGDGTFSEGGRITTNLPGVGGVGFVAPTIVCDGGNGIRFVSSSTDRGNLKWSGSAIELNGGSNPITIASTVGATINVRTVTPRVVSAADVVTSTAGAMTFDFSRAANIEHTTTENSTVSFTSLIAGQSGTLVFIQGATGRTITMPAASGTIKYSTALAILGVTAMVDTSATYITIFHYRTTTGGVILIHGREVFPS